MNYIKNKFEKLIAWKGAHNLVVNVYKITKKFPTEEKFRLTDQLCRSASSIAANIVEGNSRQHKTEYLQFLFNQCNKVGGLLGGLIKYIKSHES